MRTSPLNSLEKQLTVDDKIKNAPKVLELSVVFWYNERRKMSEVENV